jgi:hypothetical protein
MIAVSMEPPRSNTVSTISCGSGLFGHEIKPVRAALKTVLVMFTFHSYGPDHGSIKLSPKTLAGEGAALRAGGRL